MTDHRRTKKGVLGRTARLALAALALGSLSACGTLTYVPKEQVVRTAVPAPLLQQVPAPATPAPAESTPRAEAVLLWGYHVALNACNGALAAISKWDARK